MVLFIKPLVAIICWARPLPASCGTITNTVGYLGLAILFGYLPAAVWIASLPQFIVELILATVLTVALVRVILRAMPNYGEERR